MIKKILLLLLSVTFFQNASCMRAFKSHHQRTINNFLKKQPDIIKDLIKTRRYLGCKQKTDDAKFKTNYYENDFDHIMYAGILVYLSKALKKKTSYIPLLISFGKDYSYDSHETYLDTLWEEPGDYFKPPMFVIDETLTRKEAQKLIASITKALDKDRLQKISGNHE